MSWIATPVPVRWAEDSCTQCGLYYRVTNSTLCPACQDDDRRFADSARKEHPEALKILAPK